MVLQVGDRVLVFNAGSEYAFARKAEPVKVGDRVEVFTLSDGTKLALPQISLDIDDYVFVIPEWDPGFDIPAGDFQWGCLPLGAAVFSITRIVDCWSVEDAYREWDLSLSGCLMLMLSGEISAAKLKLKILFNTGSVYNLGISGGLQSLTYTDWTQEYNPGWFSLGESAKSAGHLNGGSFSISAQSPHKSIAGISGVNVGWKFFNSGPGEPTQISLYLVIPGALTLFLNYSLVSAGSIFTAEELETMGIGPDAIVNPNYPEFSSAHVNTPFYLDGRFEVNFISRIYGSSDFDFEIGPMAFESESCLTEHMAVGDKYIIYNPVTKRLVLNDSSKTVLSSPYWRAVVTPGEEISIAAVEYVWDGTGYVYLTSTKTGLMAQILFDNQIQVAGSAAGATKVVPYHAGSQVTWQGVVVSSEMVHITPALRAGKNSIVISVKDTGGGKVGFPTAVYIRRNMTALH